MSALVMIKSNVCALENNTRSAEYLARGAIRVSTQPGNSTEKEIFLL